MSSQTPSDQTNEAATESLPPEVQLAVDVTSKLSLALDALLNPKFEYDVKVIKRLPNEKLFVIDFCNELGAEGWEIIGDERRGEAPSGMMNAEGNPLNYNVVAFFCKRRKRP